jgi:predicted nucleotidyltransferase
MRWNELFESPITSENMFKHVIDAVIKVVPEAQEIWFHGSRARGDHSDSSDWDFLVVVPSLTVDRRVELGRVGNPLERVHPDADIQVATPDEAENSVTPLYWAKTEGEGRLIWSRLSEAPIADFQFIDRSNDPLKPVQKASPYQ